MHKTPVAGADLAEKSLKGRLKPGHVPNVPRRTAMRYEKQREPFYGTDTWKRLRKMVLERDHYQCQRCHVRTATVVHHIKPYKEHPELATDMGNLQSLCAICHNRVHEEKGRAKDTSADTRGLRVVVLK